MSTILIAVIILLYSFQTLFCKLYTDRYPGRADLASPVFCILEAASITLFTWIWVGFKFEASAGTLLLGVANAAALWVYNTTMIKAGSLGSYAFMNVMMLFGGILLPIIYSVIALNEQLTGLQIIGIVLMLGACVLMNLKEMKLKATSIAYYVYCLLLFISNGCYGILLKAQSLYNEAQSNEMVMVTFGIMGVIALIQLIVKEKKNISSAFKFNRKCTPPLLACLVSAALAINMLVLVVPLVNVSVLYTVENGGVLMMSAIYAVLFFKEKPTVPNVIGILLAIASITMLSV